MEEMRNEVYSSKEASLLFEPRFKCCLCCIRVNALRFAALSLQSPAQMSLFLDRQVKCHGPLLTCSLTEVHGPV